MATMVSATTIVTPITQEFRAEVAITKRLLDCVPADKLTWKPHPKSMSLGQLAGHIAAIPGRISSMAQQDSFDVLKGSFVPPQPKSLEEIHATLEQSVRDADQALQGMTEDHAESLVSPSRTAIGVSATAGSAPAGDLRPQCGHRSFCLKQYCF